MHVLMDCMFPENIHPFYNIMMVIWLFLGWVHYVFFFYLHIKRRVFCQNFTPQFCTISSLSFLATLSCSEHIKLWSQCFLQFIILCKKAPGMSSQYVDSHWQDFYNYYRNPANGSPHTVPNIGKNETHVILA